MSGPARIAIIKATLEGLVPIRKRGANENLYAALVATIRVAELAQQFPSEAAALDALIASLPVLNGRNRTYVERRSDVYQRAARYIFHGDEHTANINRYAIAVREAARRGENSVTLRDALSRGGVNQFFLARPRAEADVSTKCIRLTSPITHAKAQVVSLRLLRRSDGAYDVLEFERGAPKGA